MSGALADRRPQSSRGVVYLSSVPRDMMPAEARMYFQQYGEIFRQKFVSVPGTGKGEKYALQFKEGWFEFVKREDAVNAAASLNATKVMVKRRRRAFGDHWNVKYLPDFTWDDLRDEGESSRREHKQRRFEMMQKEKKLNEEFRRLVRARGEANERRKAARVVKRQREDDGTDDAAVADYDEEEYADDGAIEEGDTSSARHRTSVSKGTKGKRKKSAADSSSAELSKKKKMVAKKAPADGTVKKKKKMKTV